MQKEQAETLLDDLGGLEDSIGDLSTDIEDIKFAVGELKDGLILIIERFTEYLEKDNNDNKN